uniref:Pyridoxamine 5'-phosphate oxidase family protein n=1 Tax=Caenorhabditis tropicalis TaxID=1561998 RepID=A0A1I7UEV8_9PELO
MELIPEHILSLVLGEPPRKTHPQRRPIRMYEDDLGGYTLLTTNGTPIAVMDVNDVLRIHISEGEWVFAGRRQAIRIARLTSINGIPEEPALDDDQGWTEVRDTLWTLGLRFRYEFPLVLPMNAANRGAQYTILGRL